MNRNQVRPKSLPQTVAIGASHTESAATDLKTKYVRIAVTSDAYVAIGAAPVATNTSMIVPAHTSEIFSCTGGDKVSVLQVSASGVASVTESQQD